MNDIVNKLIYDILIEIKQQLIRTIGARITSTICTITVSMYTKMKCLTNIAWIKASQIINKNKSIDQQ